MVHDVSKQYADQIATLTIRSKARGSRSNTNLAPTYGEITKLGALGGPKGIRVKIRDIVTDHRLGTLNVVGEDLYALREFLAELPEEAFVRPADPVEKPERWNDGDIIEERRPGTDLFWIWVRRDGHWSHSTGSVRPADAAMEGYLHGGYNRDTFAIIRQASGQDL